MKKLKSYFFLIAFVSLLFVSPLFAQETFLEVSINGSDVVLSMSGMSGPWHVVRSASPRFDYENVLLGDSSSSPASDTDACLVTNLYFYDASDTGAGEVPADDGQPTQENLNLTSLSPNSGWEAQSITISGGGFSSEPTDNHVFFGAIPAVVTAATSTSLSVTVPEGVTTGPVLVQVGALTSNSLTFYATVASNVSGTAFQNISSIVFDDVTADSTSDKHLFISDIGTNGVTSDYLWEVMDDYSLTSRDWWNEMKGLPMDSSGNLYHANTTLASNAGKIQTYDVAAHTSSTYTTAKQTGESNSVSIVGLAVLSNGLVFAANRYDNTIRRRDPSGAGATIFVSGYTLDSYMGMMLDSAETLYFTSGGSVYKTPTSGTASVSVVATGFTNASGIDIDESTGNTLMLVADRGAGNVYLMNADTGSMDLVATGLNSPRAVAFGEDKVTGELYYYVAEANRVLRLPDPRIKVDDRIARGNRKVLISKKGTQDKFPLDPLQTADAKIKIPFDIQGKITNATTIYIKLFDPKDSAPYATTDVNDNRDPDKNGGAGEGNFQDCLSVTSVTADDTHRHFEVTLTITNQYAGDNYQVGFSFDPNFLTSSTIKPIAKTGIFTAWKRVYIEKDKMFKQGGILSEDIPSTETNTIYITKNSAGIQPDLPACSNPPTSCGYQITIFDADHPAGSAGSQTAWVNNAVDDPGNNRVILTLDHNLSGTTYQHSPETFATGQCGGVGVIGSGYYQADQKYQSKVFNDSFVEFITDNSSTSVLPFISPVPSNVSDPYFADLGKMWFTKAGLDNNFHLMGMSHNSYDYYRLFGLTARPTLGGHDYLGSGIFVASIEAAVQPSSGVCMQGTYASAVVNQDVTNHECAHEFHVNRNGTGEHCTSDSYKGGKCLEHETYCSAVDTSRHLDADSASTASTHGGDAFDVRYEADGLPVNFQNEEDEMNPLSVLTAAMLIYTSVTQPPQVSFQLVTPGNASSTADVLVIYLVATNLTDHPVMIARNPQAISTDGWDVDFYCDEKKISPSTVGYFAPPAQCPWLSLKPMVLSSNESRWIPISLIGYFDYSISHDYKVIFNYNPQQPTQDCEELIRSKYSLPLEYLAWKPLTDSFSMRHEVSEEDKLLVKDYLAWKAAQEKKPNIPGQSVSLEQLLGYLRKGGKITDYPGSSVAAWELMERIQNGADHYGGRFRTDSTSIRHLQLPQNRTEYVTRGKDIPGREQGLLDLIEQCRFLLKNHPNMEPICTWARLNLGGLLYISGDTPGAKEQLETVVKDHPDWDEGKTARKMLEVISEPLPQQAPAPLVAPQPPAPVPKG